MDPIDTGKIYDTIIDRWVSPDYNRNNGIAAHQKAISFVQNKQFALDVGCGCTGRLFDLLIENGFSPEGVDVSTKMVELARKQSPKVTIYHEDICQWKLPRQYDLISAWDSIWHVPLESAAGVLSKLLRALNPGGICIFTAGGVSESGEHENDAMGPTVYYSTLGVNGFLQVIANSSCQLKHFEFDQHPELHTFFIVQKNLVET